jgi:predicted nucleic acid-binding protein
MAGTVLFDTDVLVDFLRGHPQAVALLESTVGDFVISSIVAAELYAGVKGDEELKTLDRFLSLFRVAPVSRDIARAGGLYRKTFGKSHGLGLADAIIAATAVVDQADLKTLNTKHYPMIKGLKPAYVKSSPP